jgi:hypothetical protein
MTRAVMSMVKGGVMRLLQALIVSSVLLVGAPAHAGGTFVGGGPYCHYVEDALDLVSYTNLRALRDEVQDRYAHAAEVATNPRTIYSASPLFVWASEAKVSCAQAYGYLRKPLRWRLRPNYVTLQKCECFYERMTHYLH